MWDHFITMGKPMSRVVTNNWRPSLLVKITLKLNHKRDDLAALQFKANSQNVFAIKKAKIFDFSHTIPLFLDILLPNPNHPIARLLGRLGIAHIFVELAQTASPQGMASFAFVVCHGSDYTESLLHKTVTVTLHVTITHRYEIFSSQARL
jgi:hypothetical protein